MPGGGQQQRQQRQPEHPETPRSAPGESVPDRRSPEQRSREQHNPGQSGKPGKKDDTADLIKDVAVQAATVLGRELVRGLFGTRRRRRRW